MKKFRGHVPVTCPLIAYSRFVLTLVCWGEFFMDNLIGSFLTVYPILVMMLIGIIVRKAVVVSDAGIKEMNGLIYKLLFPVMMYSNVMASDFSVSFDMRLIGFTVLLITVLFIVLMLIVPRFVKEDRHRGVMIQGIFRSNFLVFGMSILTSLYGESRLGAATMLAAITIPYMNALSVVALETYRGGKVKPLLILARVMKNPMVVSTLIAFFFKAVGVEPLKDVVNTISKVATPFAIIVIGASLKISNLRKYKVLLTWGVLSKLFLVPLAIIPICIALGFRGEQLVAQMCIFAGPCATASYAMAQQLGGDGDLAGPFVMLTSALCVFSFFIWVFILKALNLT